MINIKYLTDKITFTCICCHYYVVTEYSAYVIMHKKEGGGGGAGHTQMSWLAYNIVHGMVSKQNTQIYIYIYIYNVKKIKQKTELFSRPTLNFHHEHILLSKQQFLWF